MTKVLDHVGVSVRDFQGAKAFYSRALAPLGIALVMEFDGAAGFGADGKPEFWIGGDTASFQTPEQVRIITPVHICFATKSRGEVDAFYQEALAAGGRDFGPPGIRAHYHANYYGAFVIDPSGHNIEAAFHGAA